MVSISTQHDFRGARDLDFCYICGQRFNDRKKINFDHVPPKSIFKVEDRNFPLKMPVHHSGCHSDMNLDDEVLGQLFSLMHGKQPSERDDKLKIEIYNVAGEKTTTAIFTQRDIEFLLRRWLKAFHAVLYNQPLFDGSRFAIQSPLPSHNVKSGKQNHIKEQHYEFVKCIKRNRLVNNIDFIETNNKKLRYECVWDQLSNKKWICVFAINLYEWISLGDVNNFTPRGCAGIYELPSGRPPVTAALSSNLEFPFDNKFPTDPFGK